MEEVRIQETVENTRRAARELIDEIPEEHKTRLRKLKKFAKENASWTPVVVSAVGTVGVAVYGRRSVKLQKEQLETVATFSKDFHTFARYMETVLDHEDDMRQLFANTIKEFLNQGIEFDYYPNIGVIKKGFKPGDLVTGGELNPLR